MFEQFLDDATEFLGDVMEQGIEVGMASIPVTAALVAVSFITGSTIVGVVAIATGSVGLFTTVLAAMIEIIE